MPQPSQIILLVEDSMHKQFAYKYLRRLKFNARPINARSIRVEMSPSGSGSAEHWVREQFPIEFEACRIRQARANTCLVVLIDADTHSIPDRIRELDESLKEAQVTASGSDTPNVIRLIPKRNIETWILCLNNNPVDETTNYKNRAVDWSQQITDGTATLYTWTRQNAEIPSTCVESLQLGIRELRKLE